MKTVDRELVSICCCASINALINNAENKLLCLNREFIKIYANKQALDSVMKNLFNRNSSLTPSDSYVDLLSYAYSSFNESKTEDYIVDLYSAITHITEITSFYRTDDSVTKEKTALIDRIYKCAPSKLIETMMNDLFVFAENNSVSSIVKCALIYLYMIYIRPFDANYKEIAMGYAKSILAKDSLGELAILLPLEEIAFDDAMLDSMITLTQKTLDATYFLKYFLERLIVVVDGCIEYFKGISVSEVAVPLATSAPTEVRAQNVTVTISEKESVTMLNKIEAELVERDPNLKRKEAHFYARHREIGKSYSIADYKRFSRCVYETARTSMDHLAELGYYEKIQIKNKFVYKTIER